MMFACGPHPSFSILCSQHFVSNLHYLYHHLLLQWNCGSYRFSEESGLKANMNKDFMAEDMDKNMEEEEGEEEGVGFRDDEKNKKIFGRRGSTVGRGGGVSPLSCQVGKCGVDLSMAKRYHRRHKVCEIHAKAPVVVVAGIRQRFCQQCSRFHELSEFDEAKRSCRSRLAGHNERRRKSSSESSAEGSSRKGLSPHLKESHCRQVDDERATGNSSFKQIR